MDSKNKVELVADHKDYLGQILTWSGIVMIAQLLFIPIISIFLQKLLKDALLGKLLSLLNTHALIDLIDWSTLYRLLIPLNKSRSCH